MTKPTLRHQLEASLAVTPPKAVNPDTGALWTAQDWTKRMGEVTAAALKSRGTGDLPEDCGRDPWSGMWNNAPRR